MPDNLGGIEDSSMRRWSGVRHASGAPSAPGSRARCRLKPNAVEITTPARLFPLAALVRALPAGTQLRYD